MTKEEITIFELEVLEILKNVMDPEIEINIVDLGLIYDIDYDGKKNIDEWACFELFDLIENHDYYNVRALSLKSVLTLKSLF